ncbi:hypothetical protein [Zobellia uliginosa]|uniref:hypothetical protein n=1 Tax=Zobellia uliginosa TaxID=143224 RepID=UPI0026E116BC|nr:hypothetical protein [Zobellia uliginosa]MDO6517790.1 hypothetical protein [Zobellia uliginosa]
MKLDGNTHKLVSYSRAGDVFHYRWAARRCLGLIQPTSNLEVVVIEGSKERKKAGEYVIDVSEYYVDNDSKKRIEYYQLKHTTVQQTKPFTLSGLKNTIIGFSERYQQHANEQSLNGVSFTIITNRKIDEAFKQNLIAIIKGHKVNKRFSDTLKKYTKLDDKELITFCNLLNLEDSEGDYSIQKEELKVEMSRFQPGSIDPAQVSNIVSLVQEKVLPDSSGRIIKEEVLKRFGVTSERQLFPAPPMFEKLDKITIRDQYYTLLKTIKTTDKPQIINAEGGVGKSVFSQYVLGALPEGSLGIAYDCFGSGKYRSRSEPRHKHRDALVQITNELASIGLCERMLVKDTTQESDIMHDFLGRIEVSIKSLKKAVSSARLVILIDAADNAEMAAHEFGDSCFANELLREQFPKDCKLILLCRPERTHLLKPLSSIPILSLLPFSKEETFENLKKWFPEVSRSEAIEFHRLTNGNPRVQMNSIAAASSSVNKLLTYLGPSGVTVEKQIEQQLNSAVQKITDTLPEDYQTNVNKICKGLASLPPNIPIHVLAKASGVQIEDVKSFVADIGRSLWLLDSSVQFRDEPTETWFRNTFLGSEEEFSSYIKILEPLAVEFTYVAEVLPQLYLQAGQYDQLISIALSDTLLPIKNPIDTRNVMVYRLQFAFKAALRNENYKDAIKLALRAGEEVAGDKRQQNLFQSNIDLLPKLQDNLKVQEIAFKGIIRSGWEGSENVYAASLLSEIEEYQGEASGYLRSALNWLDIYFKESKKEKYRDESNEVGSDDILEIALVHLNLRGAKLCLKFLNGLKPKEAIFPIMKRLISQLIDAGRFDEINEILKYARKNKYHVIAIASELAEVGRFVQAVDINRCLSLLSQPQTRLIKPSNSLNDNITSPIVTFLEVCLHRKMNATVILKVLDYYVPIKASRGIITRFNSKERSVFLKALSIRSVISKQFIFNLEALMPDAYKSDDKNRNYSNEIREFKELVGGLYPWFLLRAQLISGDDTDLVERTKQTSLDSKEASANRYRSYDDLPSEIADVSSSILFYCNNQNAGVVQKYFNDYFRDNSSFKIYSRICLLRVGNRAIHLDSILTELEHSTYELIKKLKEVGPEEIADQFILLARAVLTNSREDASIYFEDAINIVSKFGDEIVQRWEATTALGDRASSESSDELAYRFIRCTELVGEHVYREKHWDRSGALVTCTKMSPQIGISALSRWRDREIGRFEYQFESLLSYLVRSKTINPAVGWSMVRFLSDHHSNEFLTTCLENESSASLKNDILIDAYELLRKEGASPNYWVEIKSIADEYQICLEDLDDILNFYKEKTKDAKNSFTRNNRNPRKKEVKKWERIFENVNILKPGGLATLTERFSIEFEKDNNYHYIRLLDLYKEILKRIKANEIHDFVQILLNSDNLNYYECKEVLKLIPIDWKNKVSFKKKWPSIIFQLGTRYANDLIIRYSLSDVIRDLGIDETLTVDLRKGIFKGLSYGQNFADANVLFGFVEQASTFVNESDSCELIDYALSRFELHIEDDFGDGPWDKWLHVSNDINKNIAGFIWSALGSPISQSRWRACHVIKKLADFNCTQILDCLIDYLNNNNVGAYGSNQFPFYNLHARQYLLIALGRVSVDHPVLLIDYKNVFVKYAQLEPHILIQKFSADIALNIEKSIPETYGAVEISSLKEVGKSQKETRTEEYGYKVNSYFHEKGLVDTTLDYNFAYDFDRYWYEPLGDVFGVSGNQIQEICANIIVEDLQPETERGYNNDPRVTLWNRSQDRQTWYSQTSYPKTDNLDFYLSYHSMLVAAAKLVKSMQVITTREWQENAWEDWQSRHNLSRSDCKWLSDVRGPLPVNRPKWLARGNYDNWRTDILEQDFLHSIKFQSEKETWFNIKGGWTERSSSRYETYSVSTSLVSKETSHSLLRALSTCSDCHDYKIPDYGESRAEIDSDKFQLEGFIINPDSSKGIDEFDPYGENIMYPQFSLGEEFLKKLDILSDSDGRTWHFSDGKIAFKCDSWSGNLSGYDEEPEQSGMRLSASLTALKKLCRVYDCNLIIDVNISRDIEYKSRPKKDKYEYITKHKIYLLSEDGRFKSATEDYRIR